MKKWWKILLIAFHVVMLLLLIAVIDSGIILRWRLGYVLFGLAALSGIALFFVNFNKAVLDAMIKLYAFCWAQAEISVHLLNAIMTSVKL